MNDNEFRNMFPSNNKDGIISRRKLVGLIANEWFGIEYCKVDDIINFIQNIPNELLKHD